MEKFRVPKWRTMTLPRDLWGSAAIYQMVSLLIFKTPLIDSEALTWLAYKVSDLKFLQSQLFLHLEYVFNLMDISCTLCTTMLN